MRRAVALFLVALSAGCGANPGKRVPREAANAIAGSPETITAIGSLTLLGTGTDFDGGAKFTVTSFRRVLNFRRRQMRQDQTRVLDPPAGAVPQRQTGGAEGQMAFRDDAPVGEPEAGWLRAALYHHPLGFLLAAFSTDAPLSNTRLEGNREAVDITIGGETYTLFIDGESKLPVRIVSRHGGTTMETSFSQYVNLHGYKLPARIVTRLDGRVTEDLTIEQQFAGASNP